MDTTLYLTLNLLPPLVLAAATEAVARRSVRAGLVVAGVCVAMLAVRPVLLHDPCLEHRLFPWPDYALVHGWHFFLFPAIVIGLRRGVRGRRPQRALLGAAALIVVLHASLVVRVLDVEHIAFDVRTTRDGFALQSTGYSCAAASAANLLRLHGIRSSETEMARASLLARGRGIHDIGTLRALALRCAPTAWTPRLRRLSREQLVASGRPALVPLQHGFLVNHMVCVLRAHPDRVVLLDPAVGRRTLQIAEFDALFLGRALVLEPRGGALPARPDNPSLKQLSARDEVVHVRRGVLGGEVAFNDEIDSHRVHSRVAGVYRAGAGAARPGAGGPGEVARSEERHGAGDLAEGVRARPR